MSADKGQGQKPARTVFINTTAVEVQDRELSFEELVELAYPGQSTELSNYVISYGRKGSSGMETLMPGQSVKPKEGMVFDVVLANRS